MSQNTPADLVTGAFSYSGAQIAERLLDSGRGVRTLTHHPDRPHALRASVDALDRICVDAGNASGDVVIDAAGPETMPFRDLVALVRAAVATNSPILRIPPPVMAAASRALGLLLGDVVLTGDEIRGLMAGLLISHEPPLGRIAFSQWLKEHATSLGRSYANELQRHFAATATVA